MVYLSRSHHCKFFKVCLSQTLLVPFLNTLNHLQLKIARQRVVYQLTKSLFNVIIVAFPVQIKKNDFKKIMDTTRKHHLLNEKAWCTTFSKTNEWCNLVKHKTKKKEVYKIALWQQQPLMLLEMKLWVKLLRQKTEKKLLKLQEKQTMCMLHFSGVMRWEHWLKMD